MLDRRKQIKEKSNMIMQETKRKKLKSKERIKEKKRKEY